RGLAAKLIGRGDAFDDTTFALELRAPHIYRAVDFRIVEPGPPVAVTHRESSRGCRFVPHRVRGTDRASGIAGRGLHEYAIERSPLSYLPARHRIHRTAAGDREVIDS